MTIEKALLLFCRMSIFVLAGMVSVAGARPLLQELVVQCSSEDLKELQIRLGAAVIDGIPAAGGYLIALPASVSTADIKAVNTAILTGPNFEIGLDDSFSAANIQLFEAHRLSTGKRTVVALIDTGIDETHPVLSKSLVGGRNYVARGSASEWNDPGLDRGASPVFRSLQSQSTVFDLTVPIFTRDPGNTGGITTDSVNSSLPSISIPAAFGHGTMIAGIVHVVAPDAGLMPMKAFDADGKANLWNLIRAVRDSVDMGADVIHMSFAAPADTDTAALFQGLAVDYAAASNVALVAGVPFIRQAVSARQ
jgi:subtilisin family serine protease